MNNKSTILIVDDSRTNLMALGDLLKTDYNVKIAMSGKETLRLIKLGCQPDLILLDVMMPDMDGYEVCKILKSDQNTADIPIVFVTAMTQVSEEEYGLKIGAIDYITKPIKPAIVKARVKNHLQLKHYRDQLKIITAEANRANNAKSNFLSSMSHEIRTPMNAIIGLSELMEEILTDQEQIKYLSIIKRNANHLLQLINDILDISKIEAGKMSIFPTQTSIVQLMEDIEILFTPLTKKKNLKLIIDTEKPLLDKDYIMIDGDRLRQIIVNILGNAIKFTDTGQVSLTMSIISGNELSIIVADTGPGIPADDLPYIFESYKQVDSSKQRIQGTGLGLAIVKSIVNKMEGSIVVDSREGAGSTFRVKLPFSSVEAAPKLTETFTCDRIASSTNEPLKILLVDDQKDNRTLIEAFLKKLDISIDIATNGHEALQTYIGAWEEQQKLPYDIVFMDMQMPIMDGYQATRKIREWEKSQNKNPVLIYALTAFAMDEEREKCVSVGCDQHLSKPISKKKLLSVIEQIKMRKEGCKK